MQTNDQALIEKLRARDKAAFADLVRERHGGLVRVAMMFVKTRATAEEIAQDTYGSVLSSLDRFEGRSSLRTWIFPVRTNRAKTLPGRASRPTPFSRLPHPGAAP